MVKYVWRSPAFIKATKKIKDNLMKEKIKKQIIKIMSDLKIGKPLQHNLKGERSVRVKPFRLIYSFDENTLYLLRFEHRKKAYK